MSEPNLFSILPFALLLISIAVIPLLAPNWWSHNYGKISFGFGALTLAYYIFILRNVPRVLETAHDYFSFIVLVGALFVVSSGIHIGVKGGATPLKNVVFLLVGAIVANILGTTGAAMLLIRPWIRLNKYRVTAHHIVFFIFIVANVGGSLAPTGPPLYLGYLQGIPFWWFAKNCWPMFAVATAILLAIFYVLDKINFSRAQLDVREKETAPEHWSFSGLGNLFFAAVVLGAVFVDRPVFLREGLMIAAAIGSYFTTKKSVHEANHFNFHPIIEVAVLFAGIFATMIPALDWLSHNAREVLGAHPHPGIFFWSAGTLSAVLDNAPTYLGFLTALLGLTGAANAHELLSHDTLSVIAVSVGSVFFGAATYIGNNPNFMIKAIADQHNIRVPGFLGFIWKFALPFLLPTLIIVWLIFFAFVK